MHDLVLKRGDARVPSALVRKATSLGPLSPVEMEALESIQVGRRHVAARAEFIRDGEPLPGTFVVREGWAMRYVLRANGGRQILGYSMPGDILGRYVSFRRAAIYSASAVTDIELAVLDDAQLTRVQRDMPDLAERLSLMTAREIVLLQEQTVRIGRMSAYERVAHLLVELHHRADLIGALEDGWFWLPMTQTDIADTLGLSLVHVNRQLTKLRADGLLAIARGRARLPEPARLQAIVEYDQTRIGRETAA